MWGTTQGYAMFCIFIMQLSSVYMRLLVPNQKVKVKVESFAQRHCTQHTAIQNIEYRLLKPTFSYLIDFLNVFWPCNTEYVVCIRHSIQNILFVCHIGVYNYIFRSVFTFDIFYFRLNVCVLELYLGLKYWILVYILHWCIGL